MTLSAQDVHDKQFKLVRQSTGYDIDEVDAFLDSVESTIRSLTAALQEAQVHAVAGGVEEAGTGTAESDAGQPASAATRILELAQRTADEYLADAQRAADRLRTEARGLESRVSELRTYESELRGRLRSYLTTELDQLRTVLGDGDSGSEPPTAEAPPGEDADASEVE